jgi:hypothetical protein
MRLKLLILLLCCFSAGFINAVNLPSTQKSLQENNFGTCKVEYQQKSTQEFLQPEMLRKFSDLKETTWIVTEMPPTPEEVREYSAIVPSLSKAHHNLAIGFVNRKPQGETWINRKDLSWQLPEDHPRNNRSFCLSTTQRVVLKPLAVHEEWKTTIPMYLIQAKNVLIHETGVFTSSCGYYQAIETCELKFKFLGKRWWTNCQSQLGGQSLGWDLIFPSSSTQLPSQGVDSIQKMNGLCLTNSSAQWTYANRVFSIATLWDHNYHHFIIDSLSRLIRFLPFLQENKDIKIQIRYSDQFLRKESYRTAGKKIRHSFVKLLGLSTDRLIFGPVIAKELYHPRSIKCNYPLSHAYEIRYVECCFDHFCFLFVLLGYYQKL